MPVQTVLDDLQRVALRLDDEASSGNESVLG
jgi:hypothetical protein